MTAAPPAPPAARGKAKIGCFGRLLGCFGVTVGGVFLVLMVVGAMIEQGVLPDTVVYDRGSIPAGAVEVVEAAFGLEPGEELQFLYSSGLFSFSSDGQCVTDRRLLSWQEGPDGLVTWQCALAEVEELDVYYSESYWEDTALHVFPLDGEAFVMIFSTEDARDRLVTRWLEEHLPPGVLHVQ